MTEVATATITDLGFTSNGKRLYHVLVGTGTGTVNIPCMQILATVPAFKTPPTGNTLTIDAEEADLAYLVIAA